MQTNSATDTSGQGGRAPMPTQSYHGKIEWDVEGRTPREAAEEMWDNVRESTGPIVELTAPDGRRILVDLEREPDDHDVETVQVGDRDQAGPSASLSVWSWLRHGWPRDWREDPRGHLVLYVMLPLVVAMAMFLTTWLGTQ
ncbi:hypothetical protein [Amycolatopsis anabasis]|uniref:hypothetical protein n=1 Tax=Amycolatopsis anabasis TaxID=1840409 RepID=UPI00131A751C|nr:hypothetical protein [Amycolatopsis anabasis]